MKTIARSDVIAGVVFVVAAAAMVLLIGSGNLWILVAVVAGVIGILMGANRGMPYLIAFAALCSATGVRSGSITIGDVFALGAVAFGLIGRLLHRERIPLGWPYLAPVAVLLWGLALAATNDMSVMPVLIFAGSILIVLAAVSLPVRREQQLDIVAAAFVLGATLNAGTAILDYLGIFDPEIITGVSRMQIRPPGLTTHSNQLGLITNLALPFSYYLAGRRKPWILASTILLGGALASGSRGALLGAGIVTLLYIFVSGRMVFRKLTFAVAALLVAAFIALDLGLSTGLTRLLGDDSAETSDLERIRRIEVAWQEFQTHPLTGVGFTTAEAHNFYLELLRSGGLVTLLIMVVFAVAMLHAGWKLRHQFAVAVPATAAASTWFVLAIQHNALNLRFIWVPLAVIAACITLSKRGTTPPARSSASGVVPASGRRIRMVESGAIPFQPVEMDDSVSGGSRGEVSRSRRRDKTN